MNNEDTERLAAIGLAVIQHIHGADNERAVKQATPERVVDWVARMQEEKRSLEMCSALRIGRLAQALAIEVKRDITEGR